MTVLFVDDSEVMVGLWVRLLEKRNFRVICANDGIEALEVFREEPARVDVVITDHSMPGMDGESLITEIKKIKPDVAAILCSGYNELESRSNLKEMDKVDFLVKPFDLAALETTILNLTR